MLTIGRPKIRTDTVTDMKNIEKKPYGVLSTGERVSSYTLSNGNGAQVTVIDYGAAVIKLCVKDRCGRFSDVVAGYDSLSDYEFGDGYLGAVVGRVGNRIANGKFTLDGVEYTLYRNDGSNHLHGGKQGFSNKIWGVEMHDSDEPSLVMSYTSADGEEGYPGALSVTVTYKLTNDDALSINYKAQTDKPTVLNLTNHSYFNLGGYASGSILDHEIMIDADTYLPTDETLIPTGELRAVKGTAFDFTSPKKIGSDLDIEKCRDLKIAGGYDHCMNFVGGKTDEPQLRIKVYDEKSGREMSVYTDQPCVQFYTANFLANPDHPLKGGYPQQRRHAFCLETQHMPDSINHENFTDTVLRPGEIYDHTTVYKFDVR